MLNLTYLKSYLWVQNQETGLALQDLLTMKKAPKQVYSQRVYVGQM